jgi:hypothetical protein
VARQLWDALNQSRLAKAAQLIEAGKPREAATLLKLVKSCPQAGPLKQQAADRLAELQGPPVSHAMTPVAAVPVSDSAKYVAGATNDQ